MTERNGEIWQLNDQHKSRNNEESSTAVLGLEAHQLPVLFKPPATQGTHILPIPVGKQGAITAELKDR